MVGAGWWEWCNRGSEASAGAPGMPGVTADPFACNQKPTTWKSYSLKSCVAAFGGAHRNISIGSNTHLHLCLCCNAHTFLQAYLPHECCAERCARPVFFLNEHGRATTHRCSPYFYFIFSLSSFFSFWCPLFPRVGKVSQIIIVNYK